MEPLATGTRVRIATSEGWSETGRVLRWTKAQGPREAVPGYHRIRFRRRLVERLGLHGQHD
jgi:hypothetical protein